MNLNSYAKINLSLTVNAKLKTGLHEIQSYYCLVDLADKIKVKRIEGYRDKIIIKGLFAKFVKKKNNSIINLLRLLRSLGLISKYYSIQVTKNIPVFAGLGGGTSNVAFILSYLFKKKVAISILKKIENKIGSDVRLFFYKQGYLKNLSSVTKLKKQKLFFVLIQPQIKCSTKQIYSGVNKFTKKVKLNLNVSNSKNRFISFLSKNRNDLQLVVERKYPILKKLLTDIKKEKGCCFSRMTGSGSVCYGLFKDKIAAKKAYNKLKIKYPNFWFSFAKTV